METEASRTRANSEAVQKILADQRREAAAQQPPKTAIFSLIARVAGAIDKTAADAAEKAGQTPLP